MQKVLRKMLRKCRAMEFYSEKVSQKGVLRRGFSEGVFRKVLLQALKMLKERATFKRTRPILSLPLIVRQARPRVLLRQGSCNLAGAPQI